VSRAMVRGNEGHMLFVAVEGVSRDDPDDSSFDQRRRFCRMDDCHTIRRSHCWVMSRSAFWISVGSELAPGVLKEEREPFGDRGSKKAGGRASRLCRVKNVVVLTRGSEPSFQAVTNDSSSGVYEETSCKKPT
jgi:hypothetical protein